jgi:hypothetical protein
MFQKMADIQGFVNVPLTTIPFEIDTIETTRQTSFNAVDGVANILALTPDTAGKAVFDLNNIGCKVNTGFKFDMAETDREAVRVLSGATDCEVHGESENVSSSATSANSASALKISADDCKYSWSDKNAVNNGNSNGSTPRCVSIQNAAKNAVASGPIIKRNGDGANLVTSDGTSGTIGKLRQYHR